MSSATQPSENAQPFKILSLDDGGVGGLSSLLILENIMENIQKTEGLDKTPRPCERFDLIGGTGTGGIVAIMLGRLGMSIDDCIETYKEICSAAFTPGKQKWFTRLQAKSTSTILTTNLENALKKAIRENCLLEKCIQEREDGKSTVDTCQHENEKFLHKKCVNTVVLATTKVNIDAAPILFRTYHATTGWSECKIWEVARATSAMANLFKPIKLGRDDEKFMNSSFGHSNPCKILIKEATKLLSDQQEMLILSIGTGFGGPIEMGNTKRSIRESLVKMATSSRRVANELEAEYSSKKGRYHRFNTADSQGQIESSAWVEPSEVAAHTKNYLGEKQHCVESFAEIMINGFPMVSEQPGKSDGPASVYYLPFRENSKFIGRQDILSKLDDMLFTQAGFQQVALVGLGGMGKTQVALKFACMVKVKYTDYSVFWVTAASMDGFRNSCKELTAALNIEASDSEDPRRLVKNYLDADKCGKWLLILDNVDDTSLFDAAAAKEDRISSYLPQSEQGRVMITTRSKNVAWLAVKDDNLELGEMSSDDLTSMLIRGVKGLSDDLHDQNKALINEILNELCRLPLAIAQAADYMAVKQISIAEYLELLRESNEDKIDLLKYSHMDIVHPEISQSAVATTWLITFQQIRKSSPVAVNLLRFIAKVEPKAIPQTMLPGSDKKKSLVDAIGILLDYGFISRRKEPKMFDMHSLVHLTTQLWCKGLKDEEKYMVTVVDHMASIFPSSRWNNRLLWRQYLPHALRVAKIDKTSDESTARLEFKVGKCLRSDGNNRDAVRMLEHVVEVQESLAADHPSRLASQHVLAGAYRANGQISKAVAMLEHVVKTKEESLAANHPSHLTSQHALARAYRANGQIGKAVSMLEHVVKTKEESLAADHPSRLASQHTLAGAYHSNGQIGKAVSMLEHVVKMRDESLAANHPDRLASQHALAGAYRADGQIGKAVSMHEHVVKTWEESLAADHPSRLASQHALALAYRDNGQIGKAVSMHEHVVKKGEESLVVDHPSRLAYQHALAIAYCADGQIDKAVSMHEHVMKMRDESLAADHPDRLASQHALAIAYCADGQIGKAVSMHEHVVKMRDESLAADHPDRLASQHELAIAYYANGQSQPAIELLQQVVDMDETSLTRNPQKRAQAKDLLHEWLTRRADSQDPAS